jgi:hypothetical protein
MRSPENTFVHGRIELLVAEIAYDRNIPSDF